MPDLHSPRHSSANVYVSETWKVATDKYTDALNNPRVGFGFEWEAFIRIREKIDKGSWRARANLDALMNTIKEIESLKQVHMEGPRTRMALKTLSLESLTYKIIDKISSHKVAL